MAKGIRLNHQGLGEFLRSTEMHKMVQEAAEKIAANVREQAITVGDRDGGSHEEPLPVEVGVTTTDRAHANVVLAHPAGAAVQAKHGALTKAASAEGLTVRGG